MDKKLKKKFQPKKSVSIDELKKAAGVACLPALCILSREEKRSRIIQCEECRFEMKPGDKVRLIEDLREKRIVCEICFESLDISDWQFVERSRYSF